MTSAVFAEKKSAAPASRGKATAKTASTGLRIGPPNDYFEQEADRIADEVMAGAMERREWSLSQMSLDAPLRRKCSCGGWSSSSGQCDECKDKEQKTLQRKASGAVESDVAPPIVHEVLNSPGQPLDRATRDFFEPKFGYDLSKVRIHTDVRAAESSRAVGAVAYTVGHDVVFRSSRYSTHSTEGRKLLAHELAHVMQQSAGDLGSVRALARPPLELGASKKSVQRQCSASPCPPVPIPLPSLPPTPKQAELCLQEQYAATHPNAKQSISLGFNVGWMALTGKDLPERQALTCLKGGTTAKSGPHFTAKHGMYAGQPDIWDFANRTMYEVTTAGQAVFKSGSTGKLGAQIDLANAITGVPECGGLMFSPGDWVPPVPCSLLPSGLYIKTVNTNGVLVYTVLKDGTKEVALATFLAMMAAMAKKGGGAAGRQLATAPAKAAGPAYAVATLVAAAVLLGSGRAEAKLGPGDEEPIVQMFKALAQKGTPVPPEIQQMIEADPELKAKLDEALKKGGDPSAAQKELNAKILKIIAEDPDQFSKEDLEKILWMTGIAGKSLPDGSVTASKVRQMLDQKAGPGDAAEPGDKTKPTVWERAAKQGTITPQAPGEQPSPPPRTKEATAQPEQGTGPAAGVKPTVWDKAKYPGLSDDSIRKIKSAQGAVKTLWDAVVTNSPDGPKVTDELTQRFFRIVPADLTPEQVQEVIQHLAPAEKASGEEVLGALQTAVEQIQNKKEEQEAIAAESGVAGIKASKEKGTKPDSQWIATLAELARSGDFSRIPPGQAMLTWTIDSANAAEITATFKTITADGIRGAARVGGRILSRRGKEISVRIVWATPLVGPDGSILQEASAIIGNTQPYTLLTE
ncbi:MAG TPA: DUF4157 domain-containing protein [Terriglobales bacterium]|jgi:hypothetical protein|nr:DUF4157 domain-containing protein [Terriglobales bacterium]